MKFLHLSDLHLHEKPSSPDNINCEIIINIISQNYSDHYVIITGDITDDGSQIQYENALKQLLKVKKGKVFICPGNHDYGFVGNIYNDIAATYFDKHLSQELHQNGTYKTKKPVVNLIEDQVLLIGLNSNLETTSPFDFARGEIGESQLNDLETIINDSNYKGKTKIVFCHHHPLNYTNPFMELNDANSFLKIIRNKIDILLFGHRHLPKMWKNYDGIQVISSCNKSTELSLNKNKLWCYEFIIENGQIKTNIVYFN